MGLVPAPPPWRPDEEPTERQWQMYHDYLVRLMSRRRFGRRYLKKHGIVAGVRPRSWPRPQA